MGQSVLNVSKSARTNLTLKIVVKMTEYVIFKVRFVLADLLAFKTDWPITISRHIHGSFSRKVGAIWVLFFLLLYSLFPVAVTVTVPFPFFTFTGRFLEKVF